MTNKKNLTTKVMEEIKKRKLKMKPKIYFVLGSLSLSFGLFLSIGLSIFFINLISFRLRLHQPFFYLHLGRFGYSPFFHTFPWIILLLAILAIFAGIVILRKYDITYKKSFWGIAVGLVIFILIFGFFIDRAGINRPFTKMPPMKPFYQIQLKGKNWVGGEIININESQNQLTVLTASQEEVVILWNKNTLLPFGADFEVNQEIKAIGAWENNQFIAKGILPLRDFKIPPETPRRLKEMPKFLR